MSTLKRATCRREFVIRWNYTIFDYINKPCRSNVAIPGNSYLKWVYSSLILGGYIYKFKSVSILQKERWKGILCKWCKYVNSSY